jgi:thioredoxin-like negative regulator of GroEL
MSNSMIDVTSSTLDFGGKTKAALLFVASWHEGCPPLQAVLSALSGTAPDIYFGKVDAEEVSEVSEKYEVTMVPTIIFLSGDQIMERMEGGVDPSKVTIAVQRLMSAAEGSVAIASPATDTSTPAIDLEKKFESRLDDLIKSDQVMLFMKVCVFLSFLHLPLGTSYHNFFSGV